MPLATPSHYHFAVSWPTPWGDKGAVGGAVLAEFPGERAGREGVRPEPVPAAPATETTEHDEGVGATGVRRHNATLGESP